MGDAGLGASAPQTSNASAKAVAILVLTGSVGVPLWYPGMTPPAAPNFNQLLRSHLRGGIDLASRSLPPRNNCADAQLFLGAGSG